MKIGLINDDNKNFPNLALMKISAYHKKCGDFVEIFDLTCEYDIIYRSKVFTFTDRENYLFLGNPIIFEGGTGYNLKTVLNDEIEHILPDYDLYDCNHAYGFITRGCIRKCDFCIVPKKEGAIKANADIEEFIGNKKSVILMDNNILAIEYGLLQIEKMIKMKLRIDFNQGVDARIVLNNKEIIKLLSHVSFLKPLRMSCDNIDNLEVLKELIPLLRKGNVTPKNYFIYVLVKEINEAFKIVNELKKLNVDCFAQPFIDFNHNIKVDKQLKQFARWVNCRQLRNVEWKDYKYKRNK